MKSFKFLPILALSSAFLFNACGDDSSSSSGSDSPELPDTPSFSVSSCEEITDASDAAQLEMAKSNIADILRNLGDGSFDVAQTISAQTKSTFKTILDKHPGNCEAQLGYAVTIVTDIINNAEIKGFIDTLTNKSNLLEMDVEDFNQILMTNDGKLLTTVAQAAITQAIPSLDSAILYMTNITGNKDFTCSYTYDERTFELDRGEFAPTLAALYVAKSILTMGASLNLDFSANGKYDWINDQMDYERVSSSTANQIIALMGKESAFTTIHSNWKTSYQNIPNLLDSALTYVELGLQYGIEEAAAGTTTQMNDPYIVGNDEMSDVSVADFQKALDSLEHIRSNLRTGIEITLPHGSTIIVNIAKFFDITDGWQDYFPYHQFNEAKLWNTPVEGFFWSEYFINSYIEDEIADLVRDQVLQGNPSIKDYYGWTYSNNVAATGSFSMEYEIGDEEFYQHYNITISNCVVSFEKDDDEYNYYYGDESGISMVPTPVTLSPEICKVENGQQLFASAYQQTYPNAFYFTDASGNKTISIQGLVNGKINEEAGLIEDYTLDDMKSLIFFPDVTFGGVLPGMTADAFWEMLKKELRDEE